MITNFILYLTIIAHSSKRKQTNKSYVQPWEFEINCLILIYANLQGKNKNKTWELHLIEKKKKRCALLGGPNKKCVA